MALNTKHQQNRRRLGVCVSRSLSLWPSSRPLQRRNAIRKKSSVLVPLDVIHNDEPVYRVGVLLASPAPLNRSSGRSRRLTYPIIPRVRYGRRSKKRSKSTETNYNNGVFWAIIVIISSHPILFIYLHILFGTNHVIKQILEESVI